MSMDMSVADEIDQQDDDLQPSNKPARPAYETPPAPHVNKPKVKLSYGSIGVGKSSAFEADVSYMYAKLNTTIEADLMVIG
jgi:hypothetical protein